ncbi:MAG: hypothetical protein ACLGXA_24490 [Acidobacteriota bacterium]
MATLSKNGKRIGRPEVPCDPTMAAKICLLLSTTTLGLERVLKRIEEEDGKAPSLATVYRWREGDQAFREAYARARQDQADVLFDFAQAEAETARIGTVTKEVKGEKSSSTTISSDNVQRSNLICEVSMKRAAHLNPKKYSEKAIATDDAPVKIQVEIVGVPQVGRKLKPPPEFCTVTEVKQLPSGD